MIFLDLGFKPRKSRSGYATGALITPIYLPRNARHEANEKIRQQTTVIPPAVTSEPSTSKLRSQFTLKTGKLKRFINRGLASKRTPFSLP